MSYSFTATETKTFTLTHARHLAAKVAADLKRLQRLYGHITDERINEFEGEVTLGGWRAALSAPRCRGHAVSCRSADTVP